jgi:hypothetical protein
MSIYLVKYFENKRISCERTRKYAILRDPTNGHKWNNCITSSKGIVEVYVRTDSEVEAKAEAQRIYRKSKAFHSIR